MEMSIIKLNQPTLIGQVKLDRLLVFQNGVTSQFIAFFFCNYVYNFLNIFVKYCIK